MKTLKVFLVVILGIITLVSSSCKKEDNNPQPNYTIGKPINDSIVTYSQKLAYELKEGFTSDTVWAYYQNGNPILDGNGNPTWNSIDHTPVTANGQFVKLTNFVHGAHTDLKFEVTDYFNQHSADKILVGFPEKTEVVSKVLENGKYYTDPDDLGKLNNLSSLVLTEPNLTINEKIASIFTSSEATLQSESKLYFIDFATKLLGGKKASQQLSMMNDDQQIAYVNDLVQQYHK